MTEFYVGSTMEGRVMQMVRQRPVSMKYDVLASAVPWEFDDVVSTEEGWGKKNR